MAQPQGRQAWRYSSLLLPLMGEPLIYFGLIPRSQIDADCDGYFMKSDSKQNWQNYYACQWRCSDGSNDTTMKAAWPEKYGNEESKEMYLSMGRCTGDTLASFKDLNVVAFLIPLCILFYWAWLAQGVDRRFRWEIRIKALSKNCFE